MNKGRIAVFIDRDGTVNEDVDYLTRVRDLRLIRGAAEGIAKINALGVKTILITNQSAIARGYLSEKTLGRIHQRLKKLLAEQGAFLDGVYYCPHHPDDGCSCRKPAAGMLLAAREDFALELEGSFIVGDKLSDIELGRKLGLTTILVLTGYGRQERERLAAKKVMVDFVADDLLRAAQWIVEKLRGEEKNP